MMKTNKLSEEQIKSVLDAFHQALLHAPWASSALLRVLGKKLQQLSSEFEDEAGLEKMTVVSETHFEKRMHAAQKSAAQQEVFIGLYTSDGINLRSWENILSNLPKQVVSRPVYAHEEDIKQAIRAREKIMNEAYVAIYVRQNDILVMPEDRTPKDRLGKALLTLKDKSILREHIIRFVHMTGIYRYT